MTEATAKATPTPRIRTARRAPTDLSLSVSRADLDALLTAHGEPAWLAADRTAAFDRFEVLPAESNLLYTPYIDLRAADLGAANVVRSPFGDPHATERPEGSDGLIDVREDGAVGVALSEAATRGGVTLTTIGQLLRNEPERARTLLDAARSLPDEDKLAQLTRALWVDGIVLDVPAGVRLDRPIVLRWSAGAPDIARLTRTFIRLGDGASASIVEELVPSVGDAPGEASADAAPGRSLLAGTSEISIGAGAELAMASIQELPHSLVAFQHRDATIGEGATLRWALAQLGGRLVRSRVDNRLVGDRSVVEQVEIVFGGTDQLFDLTSYTRHVGRDTTGEILSKGVLLDRARTYLKGLISIERSAIGTDSFLGEFGMNLSRQARAVAIPSLEIDQPDCRRAAHSSSVGPIDEAQIFYLESRGIPPDDARKFIVLGFLEPVVARVPLLEAQDRLRELLDAKWEAGYVSAGPAGAAA